MVLKRGAIEDGNGLLKHLPVVKRIGYLTRLLKLPKVGHVAADGWPLGIELGQLPAADLGGRPSIVVERSLIRDAPRQTAGVQGAYELHVSREVL